MPAKPAALLQSPLAPWLIVGLGALVLYVPSFTDLVLGIWGTDQQGHGPLVLAIAAWLLWR